MRRQRLRADVLAPESESVAWSPTPRDGCGSVNPLQLVQRALGGAGKIGETPWPAQPEVLSVVTPSLSPQAAKLGNDVSFPCGSVPPFCQP